MHDKPWSTIEALDKLAEWFKANFPGDNPATGRPIWTEVFAQTVKIQVSGNY